jgi:hypothetical protein
MLMIFYVEKSLFAKRGWRQEMLFEALKLSGGRLVSEVSGSWTMPVGRPEYDVEVPVQLHHVPCKSGARTVSHRWHDT